MIQNISVELIDPHPQNPRKDLGDLTELAASIAKNGIYQNLTVIPSEQGRYTVIIGHRRLAAAKLAGLETVPCIVTEMTEKEQLSTMLLENMQRSDLTIAEEAFGFQLMFDMDYGVDEIAEQTGFSESTVRKRLKIATLPEKELKDAMARGGTLEDYVKIAGIKDEKDRAKLLGSVGTNNFNDEYLGAVKKEKTEENRPKLLEELKLFAKPCSDKSAPFNMKYETVCSFYIYKWKPDDAIPDNYDAKKEYFYLITDFDYVYVLVKKEKAKTAPVKKSPQEIEANRRRSALKAITDKHRELRYNFIKEFYPSDKQHDCIMLWLAKSVFRDNRRDFSLIQELIGQDPSCYSVDKSKFDSYCAGQNRWRIAALAAYALLGDDVYNRNRYYAENYGKALPEYHVNSGLNTIYEFLCALGYELSDEEQAMKNGTHELFSEWEDEAE